MRSANFNVIIGATDAEVEDRLAALETRLATVVSPDTAKGYVDSMFRTSQAVGTTEKVVENLTRLRDLGLGYTILNFPESAYDTSGIELFEREVIPALR